MNKTLFRTLIGLGILVAVIALVAGLALTPAVQKWAVKRAVGDKPGTSLEMDHISAGMSSAELKNLRLELDGAVIEVPAATAEYSAWSYLTGGGIRVSRIDAKGIVVDLRNYSPKPEPAAAQPASLQDLLNLLLLPAGLRLEAADIDAEVIVSAPSSPEGRRVKLEWKGGGVGSGSDATFDYGARYTDPSKDAPVSAANAKGRLSFAANADGAIQKIEAHTELRAEGPQLHEEEAIILDAGAKRGKQTLDAFNLVVARRDKSGEVSPLVTVTAALDPQTSVLSGSWTLTADDERLASVLPRRTTPNFEISGEGKYTFNPGTSASTATGEIKGSVSGRENALTWLGVVGRVAFETSFDIGTGPDAAQINSANARVSTSEGKVLFSLATRQRVNVAFDPVAAKASNPSEPVATIEVGDLPLKWLSPLVAGSEFDGTAGSGELTVTMTADGGIGAQTTRPIALTGASATFDEKPLIEGLDITWDGSVALAGTKVDSTTRALEIKRGTAQLLLLKASASTDMAASADDFRGYVKGSLAADLGGLLAQPVASDWRVLKAGRINTTFDIQGGDTITARMKLDASGLLSQDAKPLGDVSVALDGKTIPGRSGEFTMPLVVQNSGRKSAVTLTGRFKQAGDTFSFTGSADGDTIYLGDVQILAGIMPSGDASSAQPASPATPNKTRDVKPFWSGVEGTFDIAITKLIQDPENAIADLKAKAVAGPDKIALEQFSGTASGGSISATASLAFEAKEPQPYALQGSFTVPSFDVGAYFKAADPKSPPELETVVTADGSFNGRGINLDDLTSRVQGSVNLKGGKGVYRGLARSTTTTVASVGAGLLGAFVKDDRVQTGAQIIGSLTDALKEFQFDEMTLKATRGSDLKLNVESLEFRAPTIHVTGSGYVNMVPETPLAGQTQHIQMAIAFKDPLAARLSQARMLTAQKDSLGYSPLRIPINLTGTLLAPDTREFWTDLAKSLAPSLLEQLLPGG